VHEVDAFCSSAIRATEDAAAQRPPPAACRGCRSACRQSPLGGSRPAALLSAHLIDQRQRFLSYRKTAVTPPSERHALRRWRPDRNPRRSRGAGVAMALSTSRFARGL